MDEDENTEYKSEVLLEISLVRREGRKVSHVIQFNQNRGAK